MSANVTIRLCHRDDIPTLLDLVRSGHHTTEDGYFETALTEQEEEKRLVFLAYIGGDLCGYVHLNFFPRYTPFLRLGIPEFQDLFVHPDARGQGAATALIKACENHVRTLGKPDIGLGVGVIGQFGPAQRLYTKLGYLPDGGGVVFDRIPVQQGDVRPIDARFCLMMVKTLT